MRKLCNGTHGNIIEVFTHGKFPDSSYSFIDMELCDVNLDEFIKGSRSFGCVHALTPEFRAMEIWNIMKQIANGLVFIHENNEIHRDLKPTNGLTNIQ